MTAEEAKNVEILRVGYKLWNDSKASPASIDYWMDQMSDKELTWRSLAGGAAGMEFTRNAHSKPEVRRYFDELARDWAMQSFTVQEFIAAGDRVVMIGHCAWTNRKTGKTLSTPKADVIKFREGKIVDFLEFYDTAAGIAAAT